MDTLSKFGEIYIQQVRDTTLLHLDLALHGKMKDKDNLNISQQLNQFSYEQITLIKEIATKFIDETLHNTLFMFEQNSDFKIIDGNNANLVGLSDGLSGELYTENGWIARFSHRLDRVCEI